MTLVTSRPATTMSSSMILDPLPSPSSENASGGPRYRPFASANHHVTKGRYITSNDPRGYIPVYEYPLNGQWIMLDMDDGYVLWTGIWKALGNSKADIVKMIESQPELAPRLRRVRGGYLKIQGTWMPYEIALKLARRVAWPIRYELIPLFGPTFPDTCLSPDQPGFGQIVKPGTGKRRRRHIQPANVADLQHDWNLTPSLHARPATAPSRHPPSAYHAPTQQPYSNFQPRRYSLSDDTQDDPTESSIVLQHPYGDQPNSHWRPGTASTSTSSDKYSNVSPSFNHSAPGPGMRYSPYPNPLQARPRGNGSTHAQPSTSPSSTSPSDYSSSFFHPFMEPEKIVLPPIVPPKDRESLTLPPISTLDDRARAGICDDSSAVLKRLRSIRDDIPPSALGTGVGVGTSGNSMDNSSSLSATTSSGVVNARRLSAPTMSQTSRWDGSQSTSGSSVMLPSHSLSSSAPSGSANASASPTSSYSSPYSRPAHTSSTSPVRSHQSVSSPVDDVRFSRQYEENHEPTDVYHSRVDHHRLQSGEPSRYDGNERLPNPTRQSWRPW
ncbi:unnamed protein product [Somion occarium]|uniref:HTH APSES-type domain-containing protein n=1 Tax=Somion occarium TaxID=3059160 RepID=A0ABP1E773_9APHY